ncbi:unnamed protein product, partial [Prorocentrum cordatum]
HMLMPSIASHHVAATVLLGAPRANLSQFAAAPKPSAQGSPQESRGNGSPGRSERSAACPGRAGLRDSGVAPPGLGGRAERPQRGDGAGVGPMADDPMTGGQGADEEGLRQRLVETRSTVEGLLKQQQAEQALAEALRHPPYGGSEETKDAKGPRPRTRASRRPSAPSGRRTEHAALTKYLYKFWESGQPARTNAQLFTWHAALVEHAGQGCIARALYDMRWP